jgi:hypothetical protein
MMGRNRHNDPGPAQLFSTSQSRATRATTTPDPIDVEVFSALALGRGDGRYAKMLRALSRADLLILDDWEPETLTTHNVLT